MGACYIDAFVWHRGIADGSYNFSYKDNLFSVSSSLLSFSYDMDDGSVSANLEKGFGIGINLEGWVRENDLYLKAEDIHFPLTLLNRLFVKPIFGFIDGIAEGEVIIGGTMAQPGLRTALPDSASMDLSGFPKISCP